MTPSASFHQCGWPGRSGKAVIAGGVPLRPGSGWPADIPCRPVDADRHSRRPPGRRDPAARIRRDSIMVVARCGFREYFDPITGAGPGGNEFS
jgi:hypothetical protein